MAKLLIDKIGIQGKQSDGVPQRQLYFRYRRMTAGSWASSDTCITESPGPNVMLEPMSSTCNDLAILTHMLHANHG
jgi:hypothetical protein